MTLTPRGWKWAIFPDGRKCYFIDGIPSINGICGYCGRDHSKFNVEVMEIVAE